MSANLRPGPVRLRFDFGGIATVNAGGTARNFASYGYKVSPLPDEAKHVLCDPQTSGGLLVSVRADGSKAFLCAAAARGLDLQPFGRLVADARFQVTVS